jgi:ribosomal protein S18 acetylase RimI-like enzyme
MKKNRYFYFTLSLAGILSIASIRSMEIEENQKLQIEPYNDERDYTAVNEVFKGDWDKLATGSYDEAMVKELFKDLSRAEFPHTFKRLNVLRNQDNTIGFITYHLKEKQQDETFIEIFGISKPYRRQHNAQRFLEHELAQMKQFGATQIKLHVKQDNEPAVNLYKKLGFEITKTGKTKYEMTLKVLSQVQQNA